MTKESLNRGRQLEFARVSRGLTQLQLVNKVKGLTLVDLSRFENGYNEISDDLLNDIFITLDWPIDWLERSPVCRIDVKFKQ